MRAMAARMRSYAAKTSVDLFRRKFERAASELEEAAVDVESRGGAGSKTRKNKDRLAS